MKKNYILPCCLMLISGVGQLKSQCASQTTLGTATNMFTLIRNGNNPVAVENSMSLIAFVHRNDAAIFGGNSGHLNYDWSTNAGTTWTLNQGFLNPTNSNLARYPNLAIYNPTNNTTPSNAYVSYMAPTINAATSAWNGIVTGVRQLNGTGTTETYNQNGIGTDQIPHSLVKGAPGVFWAIDPINIIATAYNIYRGVWNPVTNDISWNINYVATPPFTTGWTSSPQVVDYNIGFDPTGQIGYFSFLGNVTGGPANNAIYPIVYKTTNGGTSWTGPMVADLSAMSCISSNSASPGLPSCNTEHDLIVDANGNPHIITTVGSSSGASSTIFNYNAWHRMYDITLVNGVWAAYELGNVNGAPYTSGISPNFATQWQAPQAARSADGTRVFFTWTDNASYSLGQQNTQPDLYGKALNITNGMWTPTKNFTSCNPALAGRITFPHMAPEVLQPNTSTYKIAVVYGECQVPNDLGQVANFYFLDNCTFATSEFSVATPPATVTIAQAPTIIYCPNSTVNISVNNAGQVLWSNSVTTNPMPLNTGSISTYSVIAQVGCLVGTATIAVNPLTVNAGMSTASVCPGNPATFTALGNALTYSWQPGNLTGPNVTLNPTGPTVTLIATGSASCMVSNTVPVNILPQPTITIAGSNTTCAGYLLSLQGNGGQSYLWSDGSTGGTFTMVATSNTNINVIGTGANSCTNTANISVAVSQTPNINVIASQTAICAGQSATLTATGSAISYSWNGVQGGSSYAASPAATGVFTVSGENSIGCVSYAYQNITVYALPSLTVVASKASVCRNERITLTASGAATYTWNSLGVIGASVMVTPSVTQTYTYPVTIQSSDGCQTTENFMLVVNACAGLDGAEIRFVTMFPNPASGKITLDSESSLPAVILNELGQVIIKIELQQGRNEIDLEGLSPGIYFVGGTKEDRVFRQKFLIED